MNLEITVKEENDAVKITVTSPDKPVVMETVTGKRSAGEAVLATPVQNESTTAEAEADTPEAERKTVSALSEKIASMNREYERLKKAAWRAKKRLEATLKELGQTMTAADNHCPEPAASGCPAPVPRIPETCPQTVPEAVPGDKTGQAVTSYTTSNTVNHNHVFNKDTDKIIDHQFIPLARLPEMYRNIVTAWNGLPLPEKLKGLYPDVAQKLHNLLKEYGEAAVHKAIHMITESPFLLGKTSNTRGWKHIYFGWLLKPRNMEKVLADKYRDRSRDGNRGNECVSYPEYIPWDDTRAQANYYNATLSAPKQEECKEYNNFHAAQSCYLDPEYMLKGLDPLTEEARSNLAWAAARLGLTKTPAA